MRDDGVVVLFPGALGDLCLLAPALAVLATTGARVRLSVQRSLVPIATMLLPTAEVGPPIDGAAMSSLFGGDVDPAVARWLGGVARVHAWLARADRGHDLSARLASLGVAATLHAVPRADADRHVSVDYAVALGVETPRGNVRIAVPSSSLTLPWGRSEDTRLLIHSGAGGATKTWSLDGFRRVADAWRGAGGEVAVVLGPAEEHHAEPWRDAGYSAIVGLAFVDLAALIASAPTWLGNDAGPSHLAGALDRRGVVLFGPTRAARWRPLGARLDAVEFRDRACDDVVREVCDRLGAPAASLPP